MLAGEEVFHDSPAILCATFQQCQILNSVHHVFGNR